MLNDLYDKQTDNCHLGHGALSAPFTPRQYLFNKFGDERKVIYRTIIFHIFLI